MHPVEDYLVSLQQIHSTGGATKEESFYGALGKLLDEVGKKLKPKVRCVPQLKNIGAGEPDFGLYTADQFQRAGDEQPSNLLPPERGVVEVKGWSDDTLLTARKEQVTKYWKKYGLVLVTNYRDFVLIGRDAHGKPVRLEALRLAESEDAFRALMAQPRKTATEHGGRLLDFLQRVMLHRAPLTEPEDLAWFLASYAREARARVEQAADLPALEGLKNALEEALGMQFEGERGEHFFRATLVQTLFYGVFSSWVLWSRENGMQPGARFRWHEAGWTLHVPMIDSLFSQIATPQKLKPLGVDEVLDWAGTVLNRVDRSSFFSKFEEEHAVQYFYEPFLKAYDPQLRKDLGVWYTPPEIVQYQVERVDQVLRSELGIADGLADDQVVILDPCCGTGAYLVETLKCIHRTLRDKGASALTAQKLKLAAMERVFGFEILPAPFVVSHLQIGLMLRQLGAPLDPDSNERAGVYLTNALTGWEPPEKPKDQLPLFPELMKERDAADEVKQKAPILVILGNPPYNAYAGTSPEEEGGLVDAYKEGLTTSVEDGGWGIRKFNLDDLYVRFFRIAERRIVKSGKGVVSFISNFSYLGNPSFVVMRKRLLEEFDKIWIDCMNGDSRETGKLTPDGKPDPSVFSTEQTRIGIRVGTAISVMVRKGKRDSKSSVRFQHYWGVTKHEDLLASIKLKQFDRKYEKAEPLNANRFSFRPAAVAEHYMEWPLLVAFAEEPPSNGLLEKRGGALIDIDREALDDRMQQYFDENVPWEVLKSSLHPLTKNAARHNARQTRERVLNAERFNADRIRRYATRPFDTRWCYYTAVRPVWNEPIPRHWEHCREGNAFLITRPAGVASPEGVPFCYAEVLGDNDFQRGHSYYFPLVLRRGTAPSEAHGRTAELFPQERVDPTITANLSDRARAYLAELGIRDPDDDAETAGLIWMHALAIGYSPAYLTENADGVRQDWPRIPLPKTKKALLKSAELGRRVAALLNTEKPVAGVTCGRIRSELRPVGIVSKTDGGALDPSAGELDLTAGWGHDGKERPCMPGKGKCEVRRQEHEQLKKALGDETLDVYLNKVAYWSNIPRAVWEYRIGGYPVVKKWLSYREKVKLGRGLKLEEAEYVTEMARRLAALILLQPMLDENYQSVKSDTWAWGQDSVGEADS
ncbi:MAG: N-6 DNA methylase [Planctomycetes bacterium]|nr:N-6 DNA methylase [Planctomycetota bacterium]